MQQTMIARDMSSFQETEAMPSQTQPPLRPALFARYGALNRLRHDYPLVLIDEGNEKELFRPLSRIIDDVLKAIAPQGPDGEELRQQVLQLEQRIRDSISPDYDAQLSDLWHKCSAELVKESGEALFGPLDRNLDLARQKITIDGKVIDCDYKTPDKVLAHCWKAMHKTRARQFRFKVDKLILRLNDILKSDHMKSDEAHDPTALSSSLGLDSDKSIDFAALSDILHRARPEDRLPEDRVKRINFILNVLQCQAFFGPGRASYCEPDRAVCYSYVFRSCSEALDAHRERLTSLVEFIKAFTIAELEVENKYVPELHDGIFASFDESDLTVEQMAMLPPAMIYLRDGITDSAEISRAFEALACGLPIKVLVQVDDILGPTSPQPPVNSFGAGTARLAAMAMGLNSAFVLQTTSAHLYRMQDALSRAMHYGGPAMFSIYSGATMSIPGIPPYILAAAATEARAFPSFTYDPSAGKDWASRFDLSYNPQKEGDWPEYQFGYEDQAGGKKSDWVSFTFGDFALCDQRYQRFVQKVPKAEWGTDMVPFTDWLKVPPESDAIQKPYILGIDPDDHLYRVIVDDKITNASRNCNDAWCRLQELAGINNSHALALLAEEKRKREDIVKQLAEADQQVTNSAPASARQSVPAAPVVEPEADEGNSALDDDGMPWIETARCTTCNECQQINDKLFGYNENMQAYILDPDGGTYRQLVEAAESCQVSIIHPGLPRNPDEPNLDELMERAALFN